MQYPGQQVPGCLILRPAGDVITRAVLDAVHRQPGIADQVGRLARPRRERAQTRRNEVGNRTGFTGGEVRSRLQDPAERLHVDLGPGMWLRPVDRPGAQQAHLAMMDLETGLQTFAAERRQGGSALEDDHVR